MANLRDQIERLVAMEPPDAEALKQTLTEGKGGIDEFRAERKRWNRLKGMF